MSCRPHTGWSIFLLVILGAETGFAVELKNRSISSSGQFIIYCDDRQARGKVSSFTEETKTECLRLLHERDEWKFPIVISLDAAPAQDQQAAPVTVTLVNTVAGPKIDVAVRVGDDPSKVSLDRHIVSALLLEMAYRDRPPVKGGDRYVTPPWWLAEGIVQIIRNRAGTDKPDVFKSILDKEKLPSLEKFMALRRMHLDSAAGAVDRACSLSLVDALLHLPNGPQNLGRFVRAYPDANGDTTVALAKHFPVLGQSPESLAKWWTLQVAGLAQSGQWQGLNPATSDKELRALEELDIVVDKTGRRQRFALADFDNFLKLPGAKSALQATQARIVALGARCDALFRPIVADYEEICRLLSAGKTRGIVQRLADIERHRHEVVQRAEQITDYLNWYEATQTPESTGEFESFLRFAESQTPKPETPASPDPRIATYLDSIQRDFAPLRGTGIPTRHSPENAER